MKNLYIFLFFSFNIYANNISPTGNSKTDKLLDSAKYYIYTDNIKAYKFTKELEKEGEQQKNNIALGYASMFIGVFDELYGENESALKHYSLAKRYALKSKNNNLLLRIMLALSNFYINSSNFKKAIETCHQGINKAQKVNDNEVSSQFYNNLSLCHSYMGDYDNALHYNSKSISLKKETNDEISLANSYLNRGLIYSEIKENLKCLEYYKKAEKLFLKTKNYIALTQTYINFAWEYTDMEKYNQARIYLDLAKQNAIKCEDKIREASVYNAFGYYYQKIGHKDSVAQALKKSFDLSSETGNFRNSLSAAKELSSHYEKIKDFKSALKYQQIASQLNDSIFNETKINTARTLNARFENQQKELIISKQATKIAQKEKMIAKRNIWIISLISIFILSSILLYFFQFKKRIKNKNIEDQKLNSVIFESEQKERIRIARDLHDSIGQKLAVMKMLLPNDESNKNNLKISQFLEEAANEVRLISHNLLPEILNLGLIKAIEELVDKINSSENIKVELETSINSKNLNLSKQIELSLYRIVQEITSNIVQHAKTNHILINFSMGKEYISVNISDFGVGFEHTQIINSQGIGWKNIFARIKLINGEIKINSNKNKGSNFLVKIPLS
jgi:two-component system, NarL family, sensor kinase